MSLFVVAVLEATCFFSFFSVFFFFYTFFVWVSNATTNVFFDRGFRCWDAICWLILDHWSVSQFEALFAVLIQLRLKLWYV